MKNNILVLVAITFCVACATPAKKETIQFAKVTPADLPAGFPKVPANVNVDSAKQAHDSCMGFAFDANTMLVGRRDSLFVGSIVNRETLQPVAGLVDLAIPREQMISQFVMRTNPCYEKRVMHFPLQEILTKAFTIQLPNASEAINKEVYEVIAASGNSEMQTGSWVYLDMEGALENIVDTGKSENILRYREKMLDSANLVLTALEAVTDVAFIVESKKPLSTALLDILKTKPTVAGDVRNSVRLFYIDDYRFEISINGMFPAAGKLMKAVLK